VTRDPERPLNGTLRPPEPGTFLDPKFYLSAELFEFEMRELFPRSWVFIADLDQVAEAGDFVADQVGYEPVVVVRGRDRVLRAFSNVCRHRGSILVDGTGNCGDRITCPYHAWTYRSDGALVTVPFRDRFSSSLSFDALGLREFRVDVWERFVFVNVSGDALPLSEYLEDVPRLLGDRDISGAVPGRVLDDVRDGNWKIFMENGYDDYHLPFVHRGSIGSHFAYRELRESVGVNTASAMAPVNERAAAEIYGLDERSESFKSFGCSIYPNLILNGFANGGFSLMWWNPMNIASTRARYWAYSPTAAADPRGGADGQKLLSQVQQEDADICDRVARGIRSAYYRPGPQHELEVRTRAFQEYVVNRFAEYNSTC
jgi:choline monooxygenase